MSRDKCHDRTRSMPCSSGLMFKVQVDRGRSTLYCSKVSPGVLSKTATMATPASLCISASSNVHVQGKRVRVTITRLCLTIGQGMPKGQSGTPLAHDSSRVQILELLKEASVACINLRRPPSGDTSNVPSQPATDKCS